MKNISRSIPLTLKNYYLKIKSFKKLDFPFNIKSLNKTKKAS